jgi:hypothetical protein
MAQQQPQNVLNGKVYVLYILPQDANSEKALQLARLAPGIHVQDIRSLNVRPPWLTTVPTLLRISDKDIKQGGPALQELQFWIQQNQQNPGHRLPTQREPHMPMNPMQHMPPSVQQQQHYTPNMPYPTPTMPNMPNMPYPPQHVPNMPYPPQHVPNMPYPPQHVPNMPPASYGNYQQQPPPQSMYNSRVPSPPQMGRAPPHNWQQGQALPPHVMAQMQARDNSGYFAADHSVNHQAPRVDTSAAVDNRLQPASGTGQFGFSLNSAFDTQEDFVAQQNDSRYSGHKVQQGDIEQMMRLREQTARLKPPPGYHIPSNVPKQMAHQMPQMQMA